MPRVPSLRADGVHVLGTLTGTGPQYA